MTSGFSSEGMDKNAHLLISLWKEMLPNSFHETSVTLIPKTDKNTRKVMTNLDSIFKSRDITLPTGVRLFKVVVFPVVMYGCESWTVKKAER